MCLGGKGCWVFTDRCSFLLWIINCVLVGGNWGDNLQGVWTTSIRVLKPFSSLDTLPSFSSSVLELHLRAPWRTSGAVLCLEQKEKHWLKLGVKHLIEVSCCSLTSDEVKRAIFINGSESKTVFCHSRVGVGFFFLIWSIDLDLIWSWFYNLWLFSFWSGCHLGRTFRPGVGSSASFHRCQEASRPFYSLLHQPCWRSKPNHTLLLRTNHDLVWRTSRLRASGI